MTQHSGTGPVRFRVLACSAVVVAGGVVAACTAGGFAGGVWWPLDLLSHFRAQYFVCLVVAAAVLLWERWLWAAAVFVLFAAVNLAVLAPLWVGGDPAPRTPRTLRAMAMNVRTANRRADKVRAAIRRYGPDVIVLLEVNDRWMEELARLDRVYPHVIARPREDNFGIALFSKYPLRNARIVFVGPARVPSVVAGVKAPSGVFTVFGTHPLPPMGGVYSRLRDGQLAAVPGFLARVPGPVVLMGDLNATPFSRSFRRLLQESGLRDSSRGWGFQPTWPVGRWVFRIPIDHFLHSPGIRVVERRVGSDVGSDHFPLIVDFNLPRR